MIKLLMMKIKLSVLLIFSFVSCQQDIKTKVKKYPKKVVIAHRGASGYLPEHTMEAKAMAYAMNPDYIEQDLVLSKDNVPIVIHDIYLGDVTDVAKKYPERARKDGKYYVIDFTFDELRTLEVTERSFTKMGKQVYPNRFPKGKSSFQLHSFQQEIELIQGLNYSTKQNIGIYPEIKNPAFHHRNGKDISKIVLQILSDYGYVTKEDQCILQCFDARELERIRMQLNTQLFLVQLLDSDEETQQLDYFATYADGIGPWYRQILSEMVDGEYTFTSLVEDAHQLKLVVHPYTFRTDDLSEFSSFSEMVDVLLYRANADGGFTDFPDQMKKLLK